MLTLHLQCSYRKGSNVLSFFQTMLQTRFWTLEITKRSTRKTICPLWAPAHLPDDQRWSFHVVCRHSAHITALASLPEHHLNLTLMPNEIYGHLSSQWWWKLSTESRSRLAPSVWRTSAGAGCSSAASDRGWLDFWFDFWKWDHEPSCWTEQQQSQIQPRMWKNWTRNIILYQEKAENADVLKSFVKSTSWRYSVNCEEIQINIIIGFLLQYTWILYMSVWCILVIKKTHFHFSDVSE